MEQTSERQFASMTGKDTVIDLIRHLSNANGKLPAYALTDTIDAINTLGQLCRTHTNAEDSTIDGAMSLVSAAFLNALTDHTITMVNEDGEIADAQSHLFGKVGSVKKSRRLKKITIEQLIEQFREGLINHNPDVTLTKEATLVSSIDDAYKVMDILTDILLVEMENTSCIHCAKMHASSVDERRIAFNAVSELREANSIDSEGHG